LKNNFKICKKRSILYINIKTNIETIPELAKYHKKLRFKKGHMAENMKIALIDKYIKIPI